MGSVSCHLKRLDDDDEVVDIPSERFLAIVGEGTPTADAAAVAQDAIHNIDVLHPESAALATVQIVLPPKRYTDLLSLLKLDGQWQIINKVRERRERVTARAQVGVAKAATPIVRSCTARETQRDGEPCWVLNARRRPSHRALAGGVRTEPALSLNPHAPFW